MPAVLSHAAVPVAATHQQRGLGLKADAQRPPELRGEGASGPCCWLNLASAAVLVQPNPAALSSFLVRADCHVPAIEAAGRSAFGGTINLHMPGGLELLCMYLCVSQSLTVGKSTHTMLAVIQLLPVLTRSPGTR
jgi:hypothetical protein